MVVTPRRFEAELKTYLEYRRRSLPVEVAILEDVLAKSPGVDDPEKLKRFLYAAWRQRQARYVLLVGDATVLPVRYMVLDRITPAAFDTAFYPSDLYYADVARDDGSLDDWNGRKDGFHARYFGEVHGEKNKQDPINFDRVHYVPVLAVGRWPVASAGEVARLVKKTIAFEGRLAERGRRPRLALVNHEGFVDARDQMDAMAARMPRYWAVERLFYSDARRRSVRPASEAEVVAALNSGVDLMVHVGHGSDTQWVGCLSTRDLAKIKNADRLPVIMSAGCSTARFATLPPYEPYVDASGVRHKGTERRRDLPRPAASTGAVSKRATQRHRPGEATRQRRAGRGRCLLRLQHRWPRLRRHAAGGLRAGLGPKSPAAAGRLLGGRHPLLLRKGEAGHAQTQRRLVSTQHFLPGDEVHALRRPGLGTAAVTADRPKNNRVLVRRRKRSVGLRGRRPGGVRTSESTALPGPPSAR